GGAVGGHAGRAWGRDVHPGRAGGRGRRGDPDPPAEMGDGAAICSGAVVYAGVVVGPGAIVGDQASVRERSRLGESVVVGRGVCVENDVSIGAFSRIQSNAYITAYSEVDETVSIAPCLVTTHRNTIRRPH